MSDLLNCEKCNKVIDSFDYCDHCGGCNECCECRSDSVYVDHHTDIERAMTIVTDYLKKSKKEAQEAYNNLPNPGASFEQSDWLYGQIRWRERMIKMSEDIIRDSKELMDPDDYYIWSMK